MNRTLRINIDRSTWPTAPRFPQFPAQFRSLPSDITVDVPGVLLKIGYLTTPTSATGVSLSEFWAWVRYLAAIAEGDDLRLTRNFADLDAHQKTILSDDFGMGVPMLWLSQTLNLQRICDGRYFVQKVAASTGATVRRVAKRGPNKTPDFVARDAQGIWHVIECKGTQSGHDFCARQLGTATPLPTGGVAQKLAIDFPRGHTGQRLVCGLSIATEDSTFASKLNVIDPELEDPFEVRKQDMLFAEDAAARSVVAKALRLAGFDAAAETTAAPFGRYAFSRPGTSRRAEEQRRAIVEERIQRAQFELDAAGDRRQLSDLRKGYRGRELSFDLPRPIIINGRSKYTAVVRQGVNEAVLNEMRSRPNIEDPISQSGADWEGSIGATSLISEDDRAELRQGDLYISELLLR